MKILWLRPEQPNNISVGRHRLALILRERGHEVTVKDVTLSDIAGLDLTNPLPEVIVGTTRLGAFVGALEKRRHGTPLVVDHIDPIHQMKERDGWLKYTVAAQMEKFAFKTADHTMVVYESEIPRVKKYTENITKTNLGVEYDLFADPSEEVVENARSTMVKNGCSEKNTLIYVGGLEPTYHISELVKSTDYLGEDGWMLLILGDGSQREWVKKVDKNRQDVCYLGTAPHEMVPGFMHEADVGISLVDDMNTLKILEYGAAGIPAVSVKGEAEERFKDIVYFCHLDPEDIADNVAKAYKQGPKDGLKTFASEHSWDTIAEEYEEVMQMVVQKDDTT